jgi:hypothetical protein
VTVQEHTIRIAFMALTAVAAFHLLSVGVCAQSTSTVNSADLASKPQATLVPSSFDPSDSSSSLEATSDQTPSTPVSPLLASAGQVDVSAGYTRPSEGQKFRYYSWNALGPLAYAGSSVGAAIDQAFDFPRVWGQGAGAYGMRVASNLGISLVTATSQYGIGEAFHEDTTYYRCSCGGFFRRFLHAAESSVTSRYGADGHREFSPALVLSPFVGPLVAANTWIPTHNGPRLGFNMGEHNLMGQFGQDEALEFLYGGPHTLLGRVQHRFFKRSSDSN